MKLCRELNQNDQKLMRTSPGDPADRSSEDDWIECRDTEAFIDCSNVSASTVETNSGVQFLDKLKHGSKM